MKIDMKHLESLSKLNIDDSQKEKFEQDFENILDFVDEITKLDLPTTSKAQGIKLSELRKDEKVDREDCDTLLNAPSKKDGCYLTPLVVE